MERVIMIKYGELTTKKGNRNFCVNTLFNNIKNKLNGYNCKIHKDIETVLFSLISTAEISRNMEKLMNFDFSMKHNIIIAMVPLSATFFFWHVLK